MLRTDENRSPVMACRPRRVVIRPLRACTLYGYVGLAISYVLLFQYH